MKKGMKKTMIFICIVLITLIVLFPIPIEHKDGGTVTYTALLYSVTKYNALPNKPGDKYHKGWKIYILGIEIFDNYK